MVAPESAEALSSLLKCKIILLFLIIPFSLLKHSDTHKIYSIYKTVHPASSSSSPETV